MTFKNGDAVRLKTNGLVMTVSGVEDDKVHCHWFNDGALYNDMFPIHLIDLYDNSDL